MKKLTTQEFIKLARGVHGDAYDYKRSVYTKSIEKLIITCRAHGDFMQRPNDHLSGGNGCPKCKFDKIATLKRSNIERVIGQFVETHGERYDYSAVNYSNMKSKVPIECRKHGTFLISPEKHILGQGCRKCNLSAGEAMVAVTLSKLGIPFEIEKTFQDLRLVNNLRFDFYLSNKNALIEYDGKQHADLASALRHCTTTEDEAIEKFLKTIERDVMKNCFANSSRIYLLRISHKTNRKKIEDVILRFIETVDADPENLDATGSYVIASESLLRGFGE